jgi:hypothetical protein
MVQRRIGVGKRTLTDALEAPIQRLGAGREPASSDAVKAAASLGTSGAPQSLPHLDRIQRLFGPHDVAGVQAYVGGSAAEGAGRMGAEAFATGNQVAFAAPPDLHTAAHEAAHVVQQRSGVHLKGGVGEEGDVYERQADEVADRVVQGLPAGDLLGGAGGAGGAPAVQARFTRNGDPLAKDVAKADIERRRLTSDQLARLLLLNEAPDPHDLDEEIRRVVAGAPGDPMWLLGELRKWYGQLPVILQQSLEDAAGSGIQAMFRVIEEWMRDRTTQKKVGAKASARLQIAHMAIATVKQKLAAGAGNQLAAVLATGGNASKRATLAKQMAPSDKGNLSVSIARAAEIAQSGSCREYASLLYHELVQLGVTPLEIVRPPSVDHTFVLIGSTKSEDLSDCVAADAWPSVTQACLLEDHFTFAGKLQPGSVTPSDGAPEIASSKSRAALAAALRETGIDLSKLNFAPAATKNLQPIQYMFADEPVIPSSVLLRDPTPQASSQMAEEARLAQVGYGPPASSPAVTPSTSSVPVVTASPAVDIEGALAAIEEAFLDEANEKVADATALAALQKLIAKQPDARARIVAFAKGLSNDVHKALQ